MKELELIDINNTERLDQLRSSGVVFVEELENQLEELAEIEHPTIIGTKDGATKIKEYQDTRSFESVYCFFPWLNKCVHILNEDLFFKVKTARNKNLITHEEQTAYRNAHVAIAGLSVGSNIARLCALQGGPKRMNIADADKLSLSNLNRVLGTVADIGVEKTVALKRHMLELDPYLELTTFDTGITTETINDFLMVNGKQVDVIVEEIDTIGMKIALRKEAAARQIPLISLTDNGDGVLIDVERYDQGFPEAEGLKRYAQLPPPDPSLSKAEIGKIVTNVIGKEDVATTMLESVLQVGVTLASWPQLGGAAVMAGSVGAYCIRAIVTGQGLASGRYTIDIPTVVGVSEDLTKRKQLLDQF